MKNEKCVIVLDEALPLGLLANTAAILGITIGKQMPEVVGEKVRDETGAEHLGIITFPVPILRSTAEELKALREKLSSSDAGVTVADFTSLAQSCKTYEEYIERMQVTPASQLQYFGLAICGPKKEVNKLTGSMALLR